MTKLPSSQAFHLSMIAAFSILLSACSSAFMTTHRSDWQIEVASMTELFSSPWDEYSWFRFDSGVIFTPVNRDSVRPVSYVVAPDGHVVSSHSQLSAISESGRFAIGFEGLADLSQNKTLFNRNLLNPGMLQAPPEDQFSVVSPTGKLVAVFSPRGVPRAHRNELVFLRFLTDQGQLAVDYSEFLREQIESTRQGASIFGRFATDNTFILVLDQYSDNSRVVSLDLTTGKSSLSSHARHNVGSPSIQVRNGLVAVVWKGPAGEVAVFNENGMKLWSREVSGVISGVQGSAGPILSSSGKYLAFDVLDGTNSSLVVMNTRTGEVVWSESGYLAPIGFSEYHHFLIAAGEAGFKRIWFDSREVETLHLPNTFRKDSLWKVFANSNYFYSSNFPPALKSKN